MVPLSATSLGNLSSLDQLTNDDELPTDPSNSSDTQEEGEFLEPTGAEFHGKTFYISANIENTISSDADMGDLRGKDGIVDSFYRGQILTNRKVVFSPHLLSFIPTNLKQRDR